jgi:hypothetical protein
MLSRVYNQILLSKLLDNYSFNILNECLDKYINDLNFNININKHFDKKKTIVFPSGISVNISKVKKRRNENFPSDISENIAKFAIYKKYGIMPSWNTDKGDLIYNKKRLEIKGFMSVGPSSFGPTETWDKIYFVNAIDIFNKNFKVYEISLSNKCEIFRKIQISQNETFGHIADSGKRPRGDFYGVIKPQIENYCKLIFDGHISNLEVTLRDEWEKVKTIQQEWQEWEITIK